MSATSAQNFGRVPFEPLKEIRFAVVIYGGVSLAIYINGIVQEMLKLVRATAPRENLRSDEPMLNPGGTHELKSSERIYRKLGQILNDPDLSPRAALEQVDAGIPQPIRTRFVIDIISGTSAGGINAIFLGKALANNQELEDLDNLWISQGDIDSLINDRRSLKPPLVQQSPPQSLLNSHRMYLELLKAMDSMDTKQPGVAPSPLVDRLDLFSTTTDIRGITTPISLTDGVVYERRHRNVFHFQHAAADAVEDSDFKQGNNPFLAYAARCTSAFPLAFEPMELNDVFPIINTLPPHMGRPYCDPNTTQWEKFYQDYLRVQGPAPRVEPFPLRAFGDGGYLDNKPFSYAIDTTLTRHADLPVERKLVYIEPNPEDLSAEPTVTGRPNAIENSLAALLVLPRYETIREDLQRVINRNIEIERVNRVVKAVQSTVAIPAPRSGGIPDSWISSSRNAHGAGYATYERLKISAVTDELADLLSTQFGVDPRDAFGSAIRTLGSVWRELEYPQTVDQRRFLLSFDIQFRLRRIRYLRRRVQEEYAEPAIPNDVPQEGVRDYTREYREGLQGIKAGLGSPYLALQRLLSTTLGGTQPLTESVFSTTQLALVAAPPGDMTQWSGLPEYRHANENSDRGARSRAVYVLQVLGARPAVTRLANELANRFKPVMIDASAAIRALLQPIPQLTRPAQDARTFARAEFDDFESYDSAAYPITFGTDVDDNGPISIHRVSPDDANAREWDTLKGRQKLRGKTLGAFGAFLDARWRQNDILWGRLDGAERLIEMALPGSDDVTVDTRRRLIDQAHEEIVNEFITDKELAHLDWKAKLREFIAEVPAEPDPTLMARSAARSTAVVGDLLEGIGDGQLGRAKPLFKRIAFIGRMSWSFVEVSVPRSFGDLFGTYWIQLAMLFSGMLILLAIITANTEIARLAITVSIGVAVVYVLRETLRRYLRGVVVLAPAVLVILTALVTGLITALLVYFSVSSGAFKRTQSSPSPGWTDLWAFARAQDWRYPFMLSAAVVATLTGVLALNAAHKARMLRPEVRVMRRLRFARAWSDVLEALGLPGGTAGPPEDESNAAQHSARLRAAVVRAAGVRAAAVRAIRVDTIFTAAYALVFVSLSIGLIRAQSAASAIRLTGDAAVGALGVVAALMNLQANDRVFQALNSNPPDDARTPLSEPPYPCSVFKWIGLAAALGCLVLMEADVSPA